MKKDMGTKSMDGLEAGNKNSVLDVEQQWQPVERFEELCHMVSGDIRANRY